MLKLADARHRISSPPRYAHMNDLFAPMNDLLASMNHFSSLMLSFLEQRDHFLRVLTLNWGVRARQKLASWSFLEQREHQSASPCTLMRCPFTLTRSPCTLIRPRLHLPLKKQRQMKESARALEQRGHVTSYFCKF